VKRRDLVSHLTAHGCRLLREGGGHSIFVHDETRKTSSVPRHNEIKNALARKICKDLGVPDPF
jgi:predicted RNA binding protein YcfA (HicA-like mRNA interferase family)